MFESMDILEKLEADFTQYPALAPKADAATAGSAQALIDFCPEFLNASSSFVYGRDAEGSDEKKVNFFAALDKLDSLLAASPSGFMSCEEKLGMADCMYVPFLERYGVQLPLMAAVSVRGGPLHSRWPNVDRWYTAMESAPEYVDRVQGDEYSWTAVVSTFMRLFNAGNGTALSPARARAADLADGKAASMIDAIKKEAPRILADTSAPAAAGRLEAAAKLLSNHEAIVADATRAEPKSQVSLERATPSAAEEVDALLQEAVARLLGEPETAAAPPSAAKAKAAGLIARRLCVPRDMGGAAAKQLRATLLELQAAYS